jgi:hypothetical protein
MCLSASGAGNTSARAATDLVSDTDTFASSN